MGRAGNDGHRYRHESDRIPAGGRPLADEPRHGDRAAALEGDELGAGGDDVEDVLWVANGPTGAQRRVAGGDGASAAVVPQCQRAGFSGVGCAGLRASVRVSRCIGRKSVPINSGKCSDACCRARSSFNPKAR